MYNFNEKKEEKFVPEYLYLEIYPIEPDVPSEKDLEDKEDSGRGVIVIDVF